MSAGNDWLDSHHLADDAAGRIAMWLAGGYNAAYEEYDRVDLLDTRRGSGGAYNGEYGCCALTHPMRSTDHPEYVVTVVAIERPPSTGGGRRLPAEPEKVKGPIVAALHGIADTLGAFSTDLRNCRYSIARDQPHVAHLWVVDGGPNYNNDLAGSCWMVMVIPLIPLGTPKP